MIEKITYNDREYIVTDSFETSNGLNIKAVRSHTTHEIITEAIRKSYQTLKPTSVDNFQHYGDTGITCIVHRGWSDIQKMIKNCQEIGYNITYIEPRNEAIYLNGQYTKPTTYTIPSAFFMY